MHCPRASRHRTGASVANCRLRQSLVAARLGGGSASVGPRPRICRWLPMPSGATDAERFRPRCQGRVLRLRSSAAKSVSARRELTAACDELLDSAAEAHPGSPGDSVRT